MSIPALSPSPAGTALMRCWPVANAPPFYHPNHRVCCRPSAVILQLATKEEKFGRIISAIQHYGTHLRCMAVHLFKARPGCKGRCRMFRGGLAGCECTTASEPLQGRRYAT